MVLAQDLLSSQVLQEVEAALRNGAPVAHIVATTGVSKSNIYRFKRNLRTYGALRPTLRVRRGPPPKLDAEAYEVYHPTIKHTELMFYRVW